MVGNSMSGSVVSSTSMSKVSVVTAVCPLASALSFASQDTVLVSVTKSVIGNVSDPAVGLRAGLDCGVVSWASCLLRTRGN